MKRWSKLQKTIYNLFDPSLKLQIHCNSYPIKSNWNGSTTFPRYWITLEKEIIFDYPRFFKDKEDFKDYPFYEEKGVSYISVLIRSYLDTPKDKLLVITDECEITDIMNYLDPEGTRYLAMIYAIPSNNLSCP